MFWKVITFNRKSTSYKIYKLLNSFKETHHKQHTPLSWPPKLTGVAVLLNWNYIQSLEITATPFTTIIYVSCKPLNVLGALIHRTPYNILTDQLLQLWEHSSGGSRCRHRYTQHGHVMTEPLLKTQKQTCSLGWRMTSSHNTMIIYEERLTSTILLISWRGHRKLNILL
jgi:hypothetical protein